MKTENPIEETWRIKDEMAREAGYDIHRMFKNLRQWAAEHPHPGGTVNSAEELRQLAARKERQRAQASELALKDQPPPAKT